MPKIPGFIVSLTVLLLVSACAAPASEPPTAINPVEPAAEPQQQETIIPEEPAKEVAESAPSHAPDNLIGLEPKDIQALLGPVSLKRWEGEAQVMQFKSGQCVMDIYFYEAAPGGAFEATYLSTRTLTGADVDAASCLTSLLAETPK